MTPRQAILPFLKLVLTDRKRLFKALLWYTREATQRQYLAKAYDLPKGLPYVDLLELIPGFDEEITSYTYLDGTSRPIDIALLTALCKQYPDCHYLEIGSWRGESLANVARVAKTVTSLSLSAEEMRTFGASDREMALARLFSKGLANVRHVEANSLTFDFSSLGEKYDVIFVDGDHTYAGVKSDTENAFKLLRNDRSVIVWHDCGDSFEVQRNEVVAGVLDGAPPEARKHIYRVANTLCGIYTRQPMKGEFLEYPQVPTKTFNMRIQAQALASKK